MNNSMKKIVLLGFLSPLLLVASCGSDNDTPVVVEPPVVVTPTPVNYTYQVNITNLTYAQPMSPIAVVLHNEGKLWQLGTMASTELENLAESGDNTMVLGQSMVLSGQSGADVLMPGASETISITLTDTEPMMMSLATMLINTNDAFTGFNAMDITNLVVGESISLRTSSYDAGTEKNSETLATIPGPVGGGEGFNVTRDDVDFVSMHPGVVSVDDGLSTSGLTQSHRFANPTLSISVTRME